MSENSFLHHNKHGVYPALLHIADLAKQAGAEHEGFVINALDMIQAFSYDYALVQKTVGEMEQRLMPGIIRKELMRKSPSLEVSKGDIEIGRLSGSKEFFRLSLKQLSEGFLIAGRPGAGKSNLIKRIMMELKKHGGVRMLILDCKNEYKDLRGHESFYDLLVADAEFVNPQLSKGPHKDSFAWLQVTIDLLREAGFTLLAAHKRLLIKHAQKLIQEKNRIDFFELTDRLEEIIENKFISLKERNTLEIPLDILKSIAQQFRLSRSGHIPLETFAKRDTVIRLHKLSHKHASFFARFILYWIYCWKDFTGDKSHLLVISDEAKRLNSREESSGVPYSRIIAGQGRFLNMDFIWADQYPSMLESYTSNVHTFVCFNQTGEEISYAAQYLGATEEQKHEIRNLQVGEAFVKVPTYPYPFKITISKAPEFPAITENRLQELMEPEIARLKVTEAGGVESEQPVKANEPVMETTAKKQKGVLQDWQDFLQGVSEQPHLNISQFYEHLGLSGRKGTKLKSDLLAEGMVEEQVINTNERKRPQKKLRITEKGLEYLRQSRGISGNG